MEIPTVRRTLNKEIMTNLRSVHDVVVEFIWMEYPDAFAMPKFNIPVHDNLPEGEKQCRLLMKKHLDSLTEKIQNQGDALRELWNEKVTETGKLNNYNSSEFPSFDIPDVSKETRANIMKFLYRSKQINRAVENFQRIDENEYIKLMINITSDLKRLSHYLLEVSKHVGFIQDELEEGNDQTSMKVKDSVNSLQRAHLLVLKIRVPLFLQNFHSKMKVIGLVDEENNMIKAMRKMVLMVSVAANKENCDATSENFQKFIGDIKNVLPGAHKELLKVYALVMACFHEYFFTLAVQELNIVKEFFEFTLLFWLTANYLSVVMNCVSSNKPDEWVALSKDIKALNENFNFPQSLSSDEFHLLRFKSILDFSNDVDYLLLYIGKSSLDLKTIKERHLSGANNIIKDLSFTFLQFYEIFAAGQILSEKS